MDTQKIVSNSVRIAQENKEKHIKTATIRIIETEPTILSGQSIKSTILINGQFAKAGDLIEVLDEEATDLISRGCAELVSK